MSDKRFAMADGTRDHITSGLAIKTNYALTHSSGVETEGLGSEIVCRGINCPSRCRLNGSPLQNTQELTRCPLFFFWGGGELS